MTHCTHVSLYAAVEVHKKEFENSVKQALFNALKDMSPADIKNAFSPMAGTMAIDVLQSPSFQALRKDAERYRYLKKGGGWVVAATQTGFHVDGEELDDLIDREMKQ